MRCISCQLCDGVPCVLGMTKGFQDSPRKVCICELSRHSMAARTPKHFARHAQLQQTFNHQQEDSGLCGHNGVLDWLRGPTPTQCGRVLNPPQAQTMARPLWNASTPPVPFTPDLVSTWLLSLSLTRFVPCRISQPTFTHSSAQLAQTAIGQDGCATVPSRSSAGSDHTARICACAELCRRRTEKEVGDERNCATGGSLS